MPGFGGRRLVVVVTSVMNGDRGADELVHIHVIKTIDANGVELAAERGIFAPSKRTHPAVTAKHMMDMVRLIVNQRRLTREQSKGVGVDNGAPHSRLGAHLAIAFESARAEIHIRFEADRAAMAASSVRPFHL